jgi:hypothetical protein
MQPLIRFILEFTVGIGFVRAKVLLQDSADFIAQQMTTEGMSLDSLGLFLYSAHKDICCSGEPHLFKNPRIFQKCLSMKGDG